jgi:hypothetical protein
VTRERITPGFWRGLGRDSDYVNHEINLSLPPRFRLASKS